MNEPCIGVSRLDYLTRQLSETGKVIMYNKGAGQWYWMAEREEVFQYEMSRGFDTWLDAVVDALKKDGITA